MPLLMSLRAKRPILYTPFTDLREREGSSKRVVQSHGSCEKIKLKLKYRKR